MLFIAVLSRCSHNSKAQYLYIFPNKSNKGLIKGMKSSQHIAKESFGLNEEGPRGENHKSKVTLSF